MALGTGAFQSGTNYPGFLYDLLAMPGFNNPGAYTHKNLACGGTSTVVWSNSFILRRGMIFGWEVYLTSNAGVAVTIELEQGNQPPTNEGAADGSWWVPSTPGYTAMFKSGVIVAAATIYGTAYAPVPSILGRLKITPTTGNDSSTVLTLARMYELKVT